MNITLLLSADLYNGAPIADITLDGVALPSVLVTVPHGQPSQRVVLEAAPGPHKLVVGFANDAYGGSADTDRNLYLDGIEGIMEATAPFEFGVNGTLPLVVTVAPAVVPVVVAPPAPTAADNGPKLDLIVAVLRDILAQLKIVPLVAAAPAAPAAPAGPPALIASTAPKGWTSLTLTPADNVRSALALAGPAFVLLLTPGTYKQCLVVPHGLTGWLIASSTGKASDVVLDGQGGLTVAKNSTSDSSTPNVPTRLAMGKGVVVSGSAGTIADVTITGGGTNATDGHDGQAGLYWDTGDMAGGTCKALRCLITKNQNGIFGNTMNANINYVAELCDFIDNSVDGGSHDTYLNGSGTSSATFIGCMAPGSDFGNNFKTRVARVTISGGFHGTQHANRWVELADGGVCDIHGGVFVGNDAGQNVFGNGTESTNKGPGNTTWDSSEIYLGNRAADFANAGSFLATNVAVHANPGGGSSIFNSKGTPLVGLVIGAAALAPAFPAYVSGAK